MLLHTVSKLSTAEPHEPGGRGQVAGALLQRFSDQARFKAFNGNPLVQRVEGIQQRRARRLRGI